MAVDNISRKPRVSNKSFRLSSRTKCLLALLPFADAGQRAAFRSMMVEAQVAANTVVKRDKREAPFAPKA